MGWLYREKKEPGGHAPRARGRPTRTPAIPVPRAEIRILQPGRLMVLQQIHHRIHREIYRIQREMEIPMIIINAQWFSTNRDIEPIPKITSTRNLESRIQKRKDISINNLHSGKHTESDGWWFRDTLCTHSKRKRTTRIPQRSSISRFITLWVPPKMGERVNLNSPLPMTRGHFSPRQRMKWKVPHLIITHSLSVYTLFSYLLFIPHSVLPRTLSIENLKFQWKNKEENLLSTK